MTLFILTSCVAFELAPPHPPPEEMLFHSPLSQSGVTSYVGGGRSPTFKLHKLLPHVDCLGKVLKPDAVMKFLVHKHQNVAKYTYPDSINHICGKVPLDQLVVKLAIKDVKAITTIHDIYVPFKIHSSNVPNLFRGHSCPSCEIHMSIFVSHMVKSGAERYKRWYIADGNCKGEMLECK